MTYKDHRPKGNPYLRTADDWRALAKKCHLCVKCRHNQPEKWDKNCPKCQAIDSRVFMPSRAELNRAAQLLLKQDTGQISGLKFHPRFNLVINNKKICAYEADAMYIEGGRQIYEDTKSNGTFMEPVAKLKIAMFEAIFQVKVKIFRAS